MLKKGEVSGHVLLKPKALLVLSTVPEWCKIFKSNEALWGVPIQKMFTEVENFGFIQKQQSYSLDVIFSELTCNYGLLKCF